MTVPTRPTNRLLPEMTEDTAAFWTGGEVGELRIHRCRACGHFFHPPAPVCFRCRSQDVGPEVVSGRATVEAFTVNAYQWIPGFDPPYVIAIVSLEEESDTRLTTNIVDCAMEDVRVGMAVQVLFEQWDDVSIPLFRPAASA